MVGTRTIYEQLEIDLARLQSGEHPDKDGYP